MKATKPTASTMKNQRCQPDPSLSRENAAPSLCQRTQVNIGSTGTASPSSMVRTTQTLTNWSMAATAAPSPSHLSMRKPLPGPADVLLNLGFQGLQPIEGSLVADLVLELHGEQFAVDVAGEIEDVDLEQRLLAIHRGPNADI